MINKLLNLFINAGLGAAAYAIAKNSPAPVRDTVQRAGLLFVSQSMGELASWITETMKEAEAAAPPGPKEWSPRTGKCRCSHARSGVTSR